METAQRYRPRIVGLTVGVLLALLIWPTTRSLVRSQFALSVPLPAAVAPWNVDLVQKTQAAGDYTRRRYHETAENHPNDMLMQYADAVLVPPSNAPTSGDAQVLRLRQLAQRFPDNPTFYAASLRFATRNQVHIEQDETRLLTGAAAAPPYHGPHPAYNTSEQLAAFDRDAAEGERLDPENGYFPFMRAVGLFAAHRDAEALAALERTAQKPTWNEYYDDQIEGEWKLQEETFGTVSALPRMAAVYAILFPHYQAFRAVSQIAVLKAVEAEQAGRVEEGLAIRASVQQCGSLMRVQCRCAIGTMVGIAITQTAMMRPGGAAPLVETPTSASKHLREQRLHAYDAYLQRIGHAEQTASVDAEAASGVAAREIVKTGLQSSLFNTLPSQLVLAWVAGIVLLSSTLWMLVLGAGTVLLSRHRFIRTGQGLPSYARLGATLGLLVGALSAGITLTRQTYPESCLFLASILLSGFVVLFGPGAQGWDRAGKMGAFVLSMGGSFLLCSVFAWQVSGSIAPLMQMVSLIMGGESGEGAAGLHLYSSLAVGSAVAVPLLTLLTLGIVSLLWRVPLSVGVARGLRGCAVPIACTLLLAYGILIPFTLRQENTLNEGMKRTVQHEGRFLAELAGRQWPGATR